MVSFYLKYLRTGFARQLSPVITSRPSQRKKAREDITIRGQQILEKTSTGSIPKPSKTRGVQMVRCYTRDWPDR
jgi:hypothetical protein